mmetsp:Transcript_5725/g.18895  ORF Transcript_5725/g.18895 Transcript_5725/m.18895 type:complete len:282 (-) Transcript_5725:8366-9211(-)
MQHVDELVFVSLRAVLHGLQVARRRVLNPPRAFLVLRERRHRGTRGVRLLRKRPPLLVRRERGAGGLPSAKLPPRDPRFAELLAQGQGRGVGRVRAVAVARSFLELAFQTEQLGFVMRVEEIQGRGFKRVQTGDCFALHLKARFALLSQFRKRLLDLDVALLLGEDGVGGFAHASPPRRRGELVDSPGPVSQPELVQLRPAVVQQLRVDLGEGFPGAGDDVVHIPAPSQNLVPPRHRVPPVRRAQAPSFHDVLYQGAALPGVLVVRPLRVGKLHQHSRGFL